MNSKRGWDNLSTTAVGCVGTESLRLIDYFDRCGFGQVEGALIMQYLICNIIASNAIDWDDAEDGLAALAQSMRSMLREMYQQQETVVKH